MGGRLRQLVLSLVAILVAVSVVPSALAAESLPKILTHSDLQFSVYKGDQLTLEVVADADQAEIKWITNDEVMCRTKICEIDTNRWSLGVYAVTLIVLNSRGSASVSYRIRIVQPPIGYKPGKVRPRLVPTSLTVEIVNADDLTVRMLDGRGYSYDLHKLHVVGKLARSLNWREKLKSQLRSAMIFGRSAVETHTLGAASVAQLVKAESGRRALILESGVLRSRQLDGQKPRWTILVSDWLQIDGDEHADVLVIKPKADVDEARVVVLRGAARIFQRKSVDSKNADVDTDEQKSQNSENETQPEPTQEDSDEDSQQQEAQSESEDIDSDKQELTADGEAEFAGDTRYVRQGLAMQFRKDQPMPEHPEIPQSARVAKQIKMSTPFYKRGQNIPEDRIAETLLRGQLPAKFDEALELATEANAKFDFIKSLELLAPFADAIDNSYTGAMILADAYRGVFLYKEAFYFYKLASELLPDSPHPLFAIGTMYLADLNWKKAKKYLDLAANRNPPDEQLLHYYLGVADYRLGDLLAADAHFQSAMWAGGNQELEELARTFRKKIITASLIDVRLGADLFVDTNVLRASAATQEALKARDSLPIRKVFSSGYSGKAGLSFWAMRTREARLALAFDILKRNYFNSELLDLQLLDQALRLELGLGFLGKPAAEPLVGVFALAKAQMIYVGEDRAIDRLQSQFGIEFPAWYQIKLGVRSDLNLDPLPSRDDLYDPVIQEVARGERSHRQLGYFVASRPFAAETYEVHMSMAMTEAKYRNDLNAHENFIESEVGVDLSVKPGPRHQLYLGVQGRTRQYQNIEKKSAKETSTSSVQTTDKRKDQNVTVQLGWLMRYTTSLRGDLSIKQEQQKSNRNAYSRRVINYGIKFDL